MKPDLFTDDHRKAICRIGQGASCCRYLTMGADGWGCEKFTELRDVLDRRVSQMNAKGDNCEGVVWEARPVAPRRVVVDARSAIALAKGEA